MANQEIRDVIFNLQVRTEDGKVKIEGLTRGFVKAETAMKKIKATLNDTNEAIKNTGSISGLTSTAVLEFGRTLSDMPYGIQGVANNITQLVTIMGQLSEKAKTTGQSIGKEFGKALKGPLGIVILVQGAILALELLSKKQDDVISGSRKLAEAVATSAVELKLAKNALEDENVSLEQKQAIINRLNEEYPEFKLSLEETGTLSEENADKIDQEIDALGRLAKARAYQSLLEEEYAKQAKLLTDAKLTDVDVWDMLVAGVKNYGSSISGAVEVGQALGKQLQDSQKNITALEQAIKDEGLVELLIGSGKGKKGKLTPEKRQKVKELVLDVYGLAAEEAVKAREKQQKLMKKLGIDIPSMLLGGPEGQKAFKEGLASLYKETENVPLDFSGVGTSFDEILETIAPAIGAIGDLLSAEAEREIAIETNKTNKINDQLRQRLANEKLSAEERDEINKQIAKNEADLVRKENEINKKRFNQEKAFSIAQATISTYLAASDVLAREKMGATGKLIAMSAIITAGLANVATIARQQFVGKEIPAPNLTAQGGGAGGGSPIFNVVGASQQTQIAQAIASIQEKPIKAYVVSSDVTTAQEFDRKVIEGASI